MKQLKPLQDPVYVPKEQFNPYERFWLKMMNDKRDLPFVYLITKLHLLVIPFAVFLFTDILSGFAWWIAALVYTYISKFYFKGRFGLFYHCICHRKMFKRNYQWLHTYITWALCPLFGNSPESYFAHHMGMHHVENNTEEDTSSTMAYRRDSLRGFLRYFGKFVALGVRDTVQYLFDHKRDRLARKLTTGEVIYILFALALLFVKWEAALIVFIIPMFLFRLVAMLGNWSQHAFIDPQEPDNLYRSSINCINTVYNKICWNDGYHIVHHLRPGIHYTEMPGEFLKNVHKFSENRALVFDGIHYLHIFFFLLTKRYDRLAANLVNLNNMFSSEEEAIRVLKERTRKIG